MRLEGHTTAMSDEDWRRLVGTLLLLPRPARITFRRDLFHTPHTQQHTDHTLLLIFFRRHSFAHCDFNKINKQIVCTLQIKNTPLCHHCLRQTNFVARTEV